MSDIKAEVDLCLLLRMVKYASPDDIYRGLYNTVFIEPSQDGVIMVATEGRWMGIYSDRYYGSAKEKLGITVPDDWPKKYKSVKTGEVIVRLYENSTELINKYNTIILGMPKSLVAKEHKTITRWRDIIPEPKELKREWNSPMYLDRLYLASFGRTPAQIRKGDYLIKVFSGQARKGMRKDLKLFVIHSPNEPDFLFVCTGEVEETTEEKDLELLLKHHKEV